MEKCRIVIKGNSKVVIKYNKEFDRTLYCYFKNDYLRGIDFMQGNVINGSYSDIVILESDSTQLWKQICDNSEDFVSQIKHIEQALHLCLHISEIYCNFHIYSLLH